MADKRKTFITLFGTRPEAIKLAPVIRALERRRAHVRAVNILSGQHEELLLPFVEAFGLRVDANLRVMRSNQTPNEVCARVLKSFDEILAHEKPAAVIVQGDTTTVLAGAVAAFHRGVAVCHVEAGLRTKDARNPFPEEMNRRLVSRLAAFHFAATERNRDALIAEGVADDKIFVTGNPVVDSLKRIASKKSSSPSLQKVFERTRAKRRIVVTMHRREGFGAAMRAQMTALRRFAESYTDVAVIYPVHPNPSVASVAREVFKDCKRAHLIEPLGYADFIALLSRAWLIASDSGGVQEEAPTLGKPLLILRENTERPEAIESGVARLVGSDAEKLYAMLEEAREPASWAEAVGQVANPFGDGASGERIARIMIEKICGVQIRREAKCGADGVKMERPRARRKPTPTPQAIVSNSSIVAPTIRAEQAG